LDSADTLVKEADELAAVAEKKNDLNVLVKSNTLRAKSKEKRKEIHDKEHNIDHLEKKLKTV
jgi:hypothetical protein